MENILRYVRNARQPFGEEPFNRIDALVLSWLSYYCYPDYLKGGQTMRVQDAQPDVLLPPEQMFAQAYSPKKSRKLFSLLQKSARFGGAVLSDYREEWEEETEKQFAALCVRILPDTYFLSFRGTDPSFLGWKEDFNLTYVYPLPSQLSAARYAREMAEKYPQGKFYLGGHSKGGTVAVYAALKTAERDHGRIIKAYSFDGPGFINGLEAEAGFANLQDKYEKVVPRSSFVGMLFEQRADLPVVKSRNLSVLQHDPFSWLLKGKDFCYAKERSKGSVRLERAFNQWIGELPLPERKRVIDLVYRALNTLDTKDFNVFFKTLYKQVPALIREHRRLGEDDKAFFDERVKRLFRLLREYKRKRKKE